VCDLDNERRVAIGRKIAWPRVKRDAITSHREEYFAFWRKIIFHALRRRERRGGVPIKNRLKRLFNALGYDVRGTRMTPRQLLQPDLLRALEFDDLVCRLMYETGDALTFIQVGACDGLMQDPLRKYIVSRGWRGVMVEPQPAPARKLRELYKDNGRITVLQAALDRQPGVRSLFTIKSPAAPEWAEGLASFQKEVILRHAEIIPGIESMITEVAVDCITFESVFKHLPEGDLNLLQIDTEGADGLILSIFPFERIKPDIVHWEIKHLSLREREYCLRALTSQGYRVAASSYQDMMAVRF
jgi:FkbM family methyltransferase